MERFQLNLSIEANDDVTELERKHRKLIIKDFSLNFKELICSQNIHTLQLSTTFGTSQKLSELLVALSNLPRLKTFDAGCDWFDQDIPNEEEFEKICKNLQELHCVADILHIFGCVTLKTLVLTWHNEIPADKKMLAYKFLGQQKDLKSFDVYEDCLQDDFFNNSEVFNFHLESFKYYSSSPTLDYCDNLIRFMWSQKDFLKKLTFELEDFVAYKSKEVQNFILNNMSNLKDLFLDFCTKDENNRTEQLKMDEPRNESYQVTDVTKNIKRLNIGILDCSLGESKHLIDLFPNLKHLCIGEVDIQFFKHVSITNIRIESLSFRNFGYNIKEVYFPNLKELSNSNVPYEEEGFRAFIKCHSKTLEKIKVEDAAKMTSLTANEIIKCENLKHLSLKMSSNNVLLPLMDCFDEISNRTKPTTISFEYCRKSWFSTFKFPEDKIFWDEKIEKLKMA